MEVSSLVRCEGAARFAVDSGSFKSMGGTDGAVYLCRVGERAHVIKFIPMPEERMLRWRERLDFIHYLAGRGVNLAQPLPSCSGALFERLNVEGQLYTVVLMPLANGRVVEARYPEWGPPLFERWGYTLGTMHALAKEYPLWRREESDEAAEAILDTDPDPHMMDWRMEHAFFARWCQEPEIVRRWMPLKDQLRAYPVARDGYGVIHNDLHQWNFLYQALSQVLNQGLIQDGPGGGSITIIDFDVCGYHWFMTDLAIALYHAMLAGGGDTPDSRMDFARRFLPPFRRGYEQANQLDGWWWQEINTFLKYRQILLYVALSGSWPEGQRNRWQEGFLSKMRRAIVSSKPVLPEAFTRQL